MQVMQVMQVIWTARRQPPGESQAFGLKGPRLQAPAILYAQARASKERAQATIVKPSLPWGGEPRPAEGPELRGPFVARESEPLATVLRRLVDGEGLRPL